MRLLLAVAAACAIVAIGWTIAEISSGTSLQTSPASVIAAACSLAIFAAMKIYAQLYVVSLEIQGSHIVLGTAGLLAPKEHRFDRRGVTAVEYSGNRAFDYGDDPQWLALRISGRTLPFILDASAELFNEEAIRGLAPSLPPHSLSDADEPIPQRDPGEADPHVRHERDLVVENGVWEQDYHYIDYDFSPAPYRARAYFDEEGVVLVLSEDRPPPALAELSASVRAYLQYRFDRIEVLGAQGVRETIWSREKLP